MEKPFNYHTEELNKILALCEPKKKKRTTIPKLIQIKSTLMSPLNESILKCRIDGNTVYLPSIQEGALANYADVRKAFLSAGAKYVRNTFIFPSDAQPYIDRITGGEKVNIKKEFQFFATPKDLADELAAFAMRDFDCSTMMILEPSAGQGAIIKALFEFDFKGELIVHAYELMDINREVLVKMKDVVVLGEDFLQSIPFREPKFDRIVANPPFSKNQDIEHIYHMYNRLKDGGRIVTIASTHWQHASGKKETEFRQWVENVGAVVEPIEAGRFKESGTNIPTCMIIIDK